MSLAAAKNSYIRTYAPIVNKEVHLHRSLNNGCIFWVHWVHRYHSTKFEKLHCITDWTGIDVTVAEVIRRCKAAYLKNRRNKGFSGKAAHGSLFILPKWENWQFRRRVQRGLKCTTL